MSSSNNRQVAGKFQQQTGNKAQVNLPKQAAKTQATQLARTTMQQQTHFRQTAGASSSAVNTVTAPNIIGAHPQHHLHLPTTNAPTSLTNLAQLSGITLLPIGSVSEPSSKQQRPSQKPANHSTATIPALHKQQQQPQPRSNSANNMQQTLYNLTSIPSIRLLNQASSAGAFSSWRNNQTASTNIGSSPPSTKRSQVQHQPASGKLNSNSNAHVASATNSATSASPIKSKKSQKSQSSQIIAPSNIRKIPGNEGLNFFHDHVSAMDAEPSQSGTNFDDMLSQPSLGSTMDDEPILQHQNSMTSDDLNNISLAKLMAILNNPALTITAVDPKDKKHAQKFPPMEYHMKNQRGPGPSSSILPDEQHISITVPDGYNSHRNDLYSQSGLTGTTFESAANAGRARIPHSAANLQLIQGANLQPIGKDLSSGSVRPGNSNLTKGSAAPPEVHLDWSSNFAPNGATQNPGHQVHPSWSNNGSLNQPSTGDSFYMHDKSDNSMILSTSVRNLMMQQAPTDSRSPTVSVQLLKHIANQAQDNDNCSSNHRNEKTDQVYEQNSSPSVLEPECVLSVPMNIPLQMSLGESAMREENLQVVSIISIPKKKLKDPLKTTERRLFIPRAETGDSGGRPIEDQTFDLPGIQIKNGTTRLVHLSERHGMLNSMDSDEVVGPQHNAIAEPDDIFINRSKRVMSRIDMMVERKKRRRFERISSRASPKRNSIEDQCAESDEEWSDDESAPIEFSGFIQTQLPLEEIESEEKRDHLISVGLISRDERNKRSIDEYEKKVNIFSPLVFEEYHEIPEDISRFVDTMVKTGGNNIQLRTDSNIKRNDLPLIEGLNRNTGRMKMSYMNVLGLEKRSKRTTLYKVDRVKPATDPISTQSSNKHPTSLDLNSKVKGSATAEKEVPASNPVAVGNKLQVVTNELKAIDRRIILPAKLSLTSCREALKPTSKNEYMKSLGLMAS